MKKLLIALLGACLSVSAFASAPAGFTTATSTNMVDALNNPLASGTATFRVVDASGHPMSVKLANGGQVITSAVSVPVTNGIFSANVVDVSQTAPSFPCVQLIVIDNSTGDTVWQNNCLQPTGAFYSVDLFSTNTTPVAPAAGDTVLGDLGVNGNLSVTGNLNMGGLNAENLTSNSAAITDLNGSVNSALMSGADIGAKTNAAFASCSDAAPCHVVIPPGVYSYATTITLPHMAQGIEFTCDRNATLTFTGTGDAMRTAVAVASGNDGQTLIDGGCKIIGTAAANSGVHIRASQSVTVANITSEGFTNGDSFWVDGANVVTLIGVAGQGSQNGIRLSGNLCNGANACEWDRNSSGAWTFTSIASPSGFAANAVHVIQSKFFNNARWGADVNDVVGGSVSAAFNNSFVEDDFEGNGVGGQYGAALVGLTQGTSFVRNYFEGNDNGIIEGCVAGTPSYVIMPVGYTSQLCGTATKAIVQDNFFNDPSTANEVWYNFANSPSTDFNVVNGNAQCLVNNHISAGSFSLIANQTLGSGALTCQDGTAGGTLTNFLEEGSGTLAAKHFHGTTQVDGVLQTKAIFNLDQNASSWTAGSGGLIVGNLGAITIWQADTAPGGSCGAAHMFNIWFSPGGMYVCAGASTWKLVSAS